MQLHLHLTISDPIVMLLALYLTVFYIILFTFPDGYAYLFQQPYHSPKDSPASFDWQCWWA